MIKYENDCVGCPPEMGCLGNSCPNKNVARFYCDECGDNADLREYDNKQLCEHCLISEVKALPIVEV